ncbi:MAG: hypothetical protein AAF919_03780 [Pseudomonadota bacterium]
MARRAPAALYSLVMALHWSTVLIIVAWLFGRIPGIALMIHAGLWGGVTLVWGLRGGPSPALTGALRQAAHLSHWGLLALYVLAALLAALEQPLARPLLLAVLGAGALHGVFNLWRSSVLKDGALRRMLPRALW